MKVHVKYLVLGPLLRIGGQPVRNLHLIDPDIKRMACGRLPRHQNTLTRNMRWLKVPQKATKTYKVMECITCKRFVGHFSNEGQPDECTD